MIKAIPLPRLLVDREIKGVKLPNGETLKTYRCHPDDMDAWVAFCEARDWDALNGGRMAWCHRFSTYLRDMTHYDSDTNEPCYADGTR